ncbi:MAG: 3-ketoacyl-ACP reductase [Opitutaceae bacterium]|nr:3-ketoacyl-ACP reductase [Opitutaceae bacterium]
MTKTALITGGSRGIGFGIAKALAAEKWDLIINGVRPENAAQTALDELRATGVRVCYAQGDASSLECRLTLLATADAFCGGAPHLLINNAAVAPRQRADLLETTEESFDRLIGTNLRGVFFLTQALARRMVDARRRNASFTGRIINVGSVSADHASINRGEYCIAKAGLGMLTQLFAVRLGSEGIPVFELRPGVIKTDMTAAVSEKYDKLIAEGLCVQPRWGLPEDVGRAAASLARGDFDYSTGQVFAIDGGLSLRRL